MRQLSAVVVAAAVLVWASLPLTARPNRYGHSDREERHMLPSPYPRQDGTRPPHW